MTTHTSPVKWLFWPVLLLVVFGFIYAIKAILLPFIIGILTAYFLDPAADRLERWGLSRNLATGIICLIFFGSIAIALIMLIPVIINQITGLADILPHYIDKLRQLIESQTQLLSRFFDMEQINSATGAVANGSGQLTGTAGKILNQLLSSGAAVVNLLSLLLITPIVCFYLLRDWDHLVAKLNDLLPQVYAPTIREQLTIIDDTMSAFLRGMVNVMLILSVFYAVALSLVGLDFAIVIGLLSGFMIIIPYLGTIVSGATAIGIAYFQFDDIESILLTGGIFATGQILEGYILTPRLVGNKVGLHPVWLIFGMLAGGALFGFVGVFLAVPATAVIGVLLRFMIQRYKQSSYYHTQPPTPAS